MSGARLIVVCGLPGAGKTTHARRIEQDLRAVRMCPDEWMQEMAIDLYDETARTGVEALQWRLTRRLLALGVSVVVEWGTWAREERDVLRQGARKMGAEVELHLLRAPLELLFERLQRRNAETPPIRLEDLRRWAGIFQAPSGDEMALYDRCVVIGPPE